MAPQPSAAVHCLTKAKTQTRPEPDAQLTNSSPNLFTEEARYTVSPIPIDPISRAGVDAPTFLSTSLHPKESSSRIFHSHSIAHPFRHRGRSLPPTRLPLSLPGATKRSSTVHFESLGVNSSPVTDLHLGRFPSGTVGARLDPTLVEALILRDQALRKASWITYSINIAIALQVLLGAISITLDTIVRKKDAEIPDAVLSGCSTIIASYLAYMRGSSEPEYSYLRQQTLTNFIRKLEGFILDHGTESGYDHDDTVETFREEFERLLVPTSWSGRMVDFHFDWERRKAVGRIGAP
ncbi:hypothetical protein BGW80DRAFT_122681 [Lactifluus volemus]|nr:hypothetical protein BGW80DRAFT_122681 [Lactifluus volemus]